jgi:hypothetical protein
MYAINEKNLLRWVTVMLWSESKPSQQQSLILVLWPLLELNKIEEWVYDGTK